MKILSHRVRYDKFSTYQKFPKLQGFHWYINLFQHIINIYRCKYSKVANKIRVWIRKMLINSRFNLLSLTLPIASGAFLLLISGAIYADRIAAGDAHNLVASGNGGQFVWGANANGQLGDGTTLDALNPVPVVDIRYNSVDGAIAVASHGDNNLVLLDDATMLGWGPNENSQLGSGLLYSSKYKGDEPDDGDGTDPDDGTDSAEEDPVSNALVFPAEVVDPDGKPISNISAIDLGANFAAAINQEGNVLVWGNLAAFQDTEQEREPVNRFRDKFFDPNIEFIDSQYRDGDPARDYHLQYMRDEVGNRYTGVIAIAVGDRHLLALTSTGQVLAWGDNSAGQLGDGTLTQRPYPVYVRSSQNVIISEIPAIAAHGDASLAVQPDGRVLGWGSTLLATPLDTETSDRLQQYYARPLVDGEGNAITGIRKVALGESHALALTLDNRVVGWGSNSNGQLGDGTNSSASQLTKVVLSNGQQLHDIIEIAVGSSHSLALHRNGNVFSWGAGESGRLGDGTNIDSYYAVNVRNRDNNIFSLY
jgi:alpha-tubulin suppressor-like RCC1 family protein